MEWWLYLVRDNQNRLYTGITTDVIRRFRQHQKGTGAKNLRGKGPLHLHCCFSSAQNKSRHSLNIKSNNGRNSARNYW